MFIPTDYRIWEVINDKGESLGAYLYGDMVINFNGSRTSIQGAYAWLDSVNYTYKQIGEIYPLQEPSDNPLVQVIKNKWIAKEKKKELKHRKKRGYRLDTKMVFGKHFGNTIKEIIDKDKSYWNWLIKNGVVLLHPETVEYSNNNIK